MNKDQQDMMDSLSRNVTALCTAIDPTHSHGPETEKIVAFQNEVRKEVMLLLTNLYPSVFSGDNANSEHVLRIIKLMGIKNEIENRLGWKAKKL